MMTSDTDFQDPNAPKKPVIAEFYVDPVHMVFASNQAGRPIYEDREFVRIMIPGDRRSVVVEPVNDEHKARWPDAYKAFKEGREAPLEGTPLSEWPSAHMTPARVRELAHFHIRTIEDLASVTDGNLTNLGMGAYELRARAQKFLEVARMGTGPLEKLMSRVEDLSRENERLSRELIEANGRVAALEAKDKTHARSAA